MSEVAKAIRSLIASRALAPGEAIGQEEMAERLGVSRTPIREALNLLAAEGLVLIRPRRGATVVKLTADDIRDIFDIRVALESMGAFHAAGRIGSEDLARMAELDARMREVASWAEYLPLNQLFHSIVYENCGRPRLSQLISNARLQSEPYWNPGAAADLGESQSEHRELLEALAGGDGDGAAHVMTQHLEAAAAQAYRELASRDVPYSQ